MKIQLNTSLEYNPLHNQRVGRRGQWRNALPRDFSWKEQPQGDGRLSERLRVAGRMKTAMVSGRPPIFKSG